MPSITYIEHNGTEHTVDVPEGNTVMEGALHNNLDGIEAECGGSCACATCHCYVDAAWLDKIPGADATEGDMLECTVAPREDGSRLSCQIKVTADLDGLIVRLPETQI